MNEFFQMVIDPAHWAFEILVTLVFDGIVIGIGWRWLRAHWKHDRAWHKETIHFMDVGPFDWSGAHPAHHIATFTGTPDEKWPPPYSLCTECGMVGLGDNRVHAQGCSQFEDVCDCGAVRKNLGTFLHCSGCGQISDL